MASKRLFILVLLLGGALLLLGLACAESDAPPVIELGTRWSIADAKDLETLVASSDAVFIGDVVSLDGQDLRPIGPERGLDSAAPVPGKPVRTSMPTLPVSKFSVSVSDPVVGRPGDGDVVTIEQGGGTIENSDGSTAQVVLEGDELMRPGETYVFFALEPVEDSAALRTSPLRRMRIDDGEGSVAGRWSNVGAFRELNGLSAAEIVRKIQAVAK